MSNACEVLFDLFLGKSRPQVNCPFVRNGVRLPPIPLLAGEFTLLSKCVNIVGDVSSRA